MSIEATRSDAGVVEVVVDVPPVNALRSDHWFQLAELITRDGSHPEARVLILRAEGKGFNAGVDIKELADDDTHEVLIGVNRGCYAAFAAVYDCPVPVIAAVQGFCVGGGIGLVGNADIVVASEDAFFGLPEVDRGALGAATHLSRLVPPLKMRAMVYLSENATAQELHAYGSVYEVVPAEALVTKARAIAAQLVKKSPYVLRRAKESLNGIDPVDVKRSYRFEQGLTYELTLKGIADEARQAFVEGRDAEYDQ
ncbi:MAG TPA: enoyl-CoA hydratase family protein [Nitriliruptorales bacterium]